MRIFSTFTGIGGFERGIEQAWNVLSAENAIKSTKAGVSVRNVSQHTTVNGEQTTESVPINTPEIGGGSAGNESWRHTVVNVSAVENLPSSSSQSTISTMTGQKKEEKLGEEESTTRLSYRDSQTNTNFSATTVTLQKDSTENAPICVGYSEIDRYAIATYERNFPDAKNYGDITKINTAELPDFDLLVGGFPCQAFSVAGKRAGFEDTRGTLIFDVVRILRDKRPRYFVLENVKGLLSHDSGKTFSHILEILTDSGYDVSWSVHNSKNYGVPQNRERIYLIGNLRGERRPQVFPLGISTNKDNKGVAASGITSRPEYLEGIRHLKWSMTDISNTLRSSGQTDTATTYINNSRIRRLTPTECLRLQGFPDDWFEGAEVNGKPISDSQRYKCCGNAVTVNVVEHVVSEMFNPTQS